MSFVWKDFLLLADGWVGNTTERTYADALYRSAISRAYYTAYHTAYELAVELGMQPTSSASDHFRVRKFFENRGRVARQVSSRLYDLYDLRISADYEISANSVVTKNAQAAAQRAVEMSHKVLEMVEFLQSRNR